MIEYAPHFLALSGTTLLIIAAMTSAAGIINGCMFRLLPAAIGAATVWMSALMFTGAS